MSEFGELSQRVCSRAPAHEPRCVNPPFAPLQRPALHVPRCICPPSSLTVHLELVTPAMSAKRFAKHILFRTLNHWASGRHQGYTRWLCAGVTCWCPILTISLSACTFLPVSGCRRPGVGVSLYTGLAPRAYDNQMHDECRTPLSWTPLSWTPLSWTPQEPRRAPPCVFVWRGRPESQNTKPT